MAGNSSSTLRVALLGLGVVGRGVVKLLGEQAGHIERRCGRRVEIARVASRRVFEQRDHVSMLADDRLSTDLIATATADDVDVVVELVGGTTTAREAVLAALAAGKPVVTANKALLAYHGREVFATARAGGVAVGFEASCAAAVPVIGALTAGLLANCVRELVGILNGTCNYILTEMTSAGRDFAGVLAEAQAKGYAEADPTLDVDGHDTAHKLAVLASLAFASDVHADDVAVAGIRCVSQTDIRFAHELGYAVKLLARARQATPAGAMALSVEPTYVPGEHPLARVSGATNAIYVRGHACGAMLLQGSGAGSAPTASAVVADLIEIALGTAGQRFSQLRVYNDQSPRPTLQPPGDRQSRFYLRVQVQDRPGVMAAITRAFADSHISLSAVLQHEVADVSTAADAASVPVAVLTHHTTRGALDDAVRAINALPVVKAPAVIFPIFEEEGRS